LKLQLKKHLVFIDIEATGLNLTKDRLVEIGLLKIHPDHSQERKVWRFNPEIPMPANIAAMIGITDEDLKDKPLFKTSAKDILNFIGSSDLAGFNPFKLDLPMLMEEFIRAGIEFDLGKRKVIDVQRIFHMMEKRNLAAAYSFYCGKELVNSHSAMADTDATFEVFAAQLEKYSELGNDIDQINNVTGNPSENIVDLVGRITRHEDGSELINFGKYKGQKVVDVLKRDPAYYNWMMNGDFTEYTKKKLTEIRLRMKMGG
jgi:DNA polymerase III subunit epsilon